MENELTKMYYRIADVSALCRIPVSTIRFWESKFSELRPKRSEKGTRLYSPGDIELIRLIEFLLHERGLKIEAARDYIRKNRADLNRRLEVIVRLKDVRNKLSEVLKALDSKDKRNG